MNAVAVIGFDSEAIQNRASALIGLCAAISAEPTVSVVNTRSAVATSVTAPAITFRSTKGSKADATEGTSPPRAGLGCNSCRPTAVAADRHEAIDARRIAR